MAHRLESFEFRRGGSRNLMYPWAEWEDGIWQVTYGVDFKINIKNFTSLLHSHARNNDMKVRTAVRGNDIVFRFTKKEPT